MTNKKIIIWTIIILLIGAGILYLSLSKKNNTTTTIVKLYTLQEVSSHSSENDCWTAIDGKIYDITTVIPLHPAGKDKIMRGCGVDATNTFNRVGAHDIEKLKQNFVGNLK
ncbi:MAG: cytochrome b5-like heme/steroid binding domain-containing protein [Candidatus Paceibacterota bacterium]|jgi:cytochrome b involved in lipid metabolism